MCNSFSGGCLWVGFVVRSGLSGTTRNLTKVRGLKRLF
jgi:hypothetical protein